MAVMAIPAVAATAPTWLSALSGAVLGVLAALGVYKGGEAILEEKARIETERARKLKDFLDSGPFADDLAKTIAQAEASPCVKAYCPPLPAPHGIGAPVLAAQPNKLAAAYQCLVTKFPPGIEWFFMHPRSFWDGFWPAECKLIEAKGEYNRFFDPHTGMGKWFFVDAEKMFGKQAIMKVGIIMPFHPPVRLAYYFAYIGPQIAFLRLVEDFSLLSIIEVHYEPFGVSS